MKYTSLSLLLLVLLSACGPKENKSEINKPTQFSTSQIIGVLTDIQLVESLLNTHGDFYNKDMQNLLVQEVLDKHKISRLKLDSVLNDLETDLEYYQSILDSIKLRIDKTDTIALPSLKYKANYKRSVDSLRKNQAIKP